MKIEELEKYLGYHFHSRELLMKALTHPSYAHENNRGRGNERLEFLGDAVLDLAISHILYGERPDWEEGDLTRARSTMVNTRALANQARRLELGSVALLGRTEIHTGGNDKESILANLFESLIGAIYLDGGFEVIRGITAQIFSRELSSGDAVRARDPKTALQEWTHANYGLTPEYDAISDSGVENSENRFEVVVRILGHEMGRGTGRSKRFAERAAAELALSSFE